nr:helix-turn-helix domain-containing protein [Kineosporia mesophila]
MALGELVAGEALVVAVIRAADGTITRTVTSVPAASEPEVAARRVARRLPAGAVAGVSEACRVRFGEGTPAGSGPGSPSDSGSGRADGPGPEGPGAADQASAAALVAAARQAEAAAVTAGARPHLGPVLSWADLGFYRVLAQGPAAVEALIAGTPAARLREKADADLIRTALVWLDSGGNAARTAAMLSVHRQTLYYRLERIEQFAGVDLDEGEARLGLHIGLALGEVLAKYQG